MTQPISIGLQLYTLRDVMAEDFEGVLRKVAALGYDGVEFAGYGGMKAEDLKALLDELQLAAIGAHVPLELLKTQLDEEIAYLKTLGAKYIICPWLPFELRDADSWKQHIVDFQQIGQRVHEAGLQFAYHNHEFEFEVELENKPVFDTLYEKISDTYLKVEMDIGWVHYAGKDPLAYIRKYAGRLPLLHLKDYQKNEHASEQMDTVELGRGITPLQAIIETATSSSVEWIIVEQDHCANDPIEAVTESMAWLKQHGWKS